LQTNILCSDNLILNTINRNYRNPENKQIIKNLNRYLSLSKLPAFPECIETFIIDTNGKVIASSDTSNIGNDRSHSDYFMSGRESVYVSDLFHDSGINQVSWVVSAPLIDKTSSKLMGVLVNRINPKTLSDISTGRDVLALGAKSQSMRIGETGETYIVNRNKLMITESRFVEGAILKQSVDTEIVRLSMKGNEAKIANYPDYRGIPVFGASMIINEMGWIIITEVDYTQAFIPVQKMQTQIMIGIGLLISGIFFASGLFTSSLTRPLRRLIQADRIAMEGKGAPEIIPAHEIPRGELGELMRGRNTMLTKLKQSEGLLQESNQRLQAIIQASPQAIISVDTAGIVTNWNKAAERIFGWNEQEVLGRFVPVIPQDDQQGEYRAKLESVLRGEVISVYETRLQKKEGSLIDVSCSGAPLYDTLGNVCGAMGIVADITNRKKMEEALQMTKHQNELILNSVGEGIYGINLQGNTTFINPAAARMLGWNFEELIGKHMHSILHHSKSDGTPCLPEDCQIYAALRNGGVHQVDNEVFWRKDGTSFPVRYTSTPIVEQDKVVGAVVTFDDITERKRTELEYKTMLSAAMDGFWFTDTEGRLLDVNDAYCRLTGYSREELLTMRIQDIEDKETQEDTVQHVKKIMETGYDRFETRHRCKDGKIVDIEVSVNYVKIAGGRFFVFLRDITERKKSDAQIRLQLQRLAVISNIDKAILSTLDLRVVLEAFMDRAFPQLHVDAADILLFNPYMQTLEYAVGRGFHTSAVQRTRVRLGEGCCGRAAVERRPVFIHNLREESCVRSKQLPEESFVSHYAAPLIAKGQVNGVLEVFHRAPFAPEQEWLNFLETLAGQAAIAIDNAGLFEGLQHANTELVQAYDATIEGWSHALDLRDKETEGHSQRVTEMTVLIAANMGVSKPDLIHVRRGSLLHDIGKMGVPDNILLKIDKLTDEEWVIMRKHPVYAYEMLFPIAYLRPAIDIPYCHHEKWDGTGYPRRLKGEEVPLSARIFAVVDVWDAMRSDRPYRKGWADEKVREHIKSLAGAHCDPKVVEVFLKEKW